MGMLSLLRYETQNWHRHCTKETPVVYFLLLMSCPKNHNDNKALQIGSEESQKHVVLPHFDLETFPCIISFTPFLPLSPLSVKSQYTGDTANFLVIEEIPVTDRPQYWSPDFS